MSLIGGDNVAAKRISKEVLTLFYIVFFFLLYIAMEDYDSKNQYEVAVTINNMANDTFDDEEHNIFIDLTESILYLFKGRQLVKKYPIAQEAQHRPNRRLGDSDESTQLGFGIWKPLDKFGTLKIWYSWYKQAGLYRV